MEQLSGLDASFLYLESAKAPMHVGGVYIFDPGTAPFSFKAIKEFVASRLHISKIFRQRLVQVPLDLARPYWVNDPDFNLDYHLMHMALPKPGGMEELMDLAGHLLSKPLSRDRPLWELTFIEGLEKIEGISKGAFAMIPKVHHCAIDGMSGAQMMVALFDMFPQPQQYKTEEKWEADKIPSARELMSMNYSKVFSTPMKLAKFLSETTKNTVGVMKENAFKKVKRPPRLFSAPVTKFNVPVSGNRIFGGTQVSLKKIKELKNLLGDCTVNDVILCICAGAVRKYLLSYEDLPKKPLISMAPISVRGDGDEAGGNKISAMLVSMATNEKDPLKRLRKIHESARGSKAYSKAVGADKLMDAVPSQLASLASRLYTGMGISEMHKPFHNMIVTNVPGPPIPLYLNGAKLLRVYGAAPLFDGMTLLITVFSYAGKLFFGITSCREVMPDIDDFIDFIPEELEELELAILKDIKEKKANDAE